MSQSTFERMEVAKRRAASLVQLRTEKSQAKRFEERGQQLLAPSRSLGTVAIQAEALKASGVQVQLLDSDLLAHWLAQLRNLLNEFQRDSSTILDPTPGVDARAPLWEPLKQLPAKIGSALLESWQVWVRQMVPIISADLLEVLSCVPALSSSVREIREIEAAIKIAAKSLPDSKESVAEIGRKATRLKELWDTLASGGIPKDVVSFLREAGQQSGVPHERLTPSVLEWFVKHNLVSSLRIRLA